MFKFSIKYGIRSKVKGIPISDILDSISLNCLPKIVSSRPAVETLTETTCLTPASLAASAASAASSALFSAPGTTM